MTAPRDDGVSTPDLFVGLYASRDGTEPIGNYYEPSGGEREESDYFIARFGNRRLTCERIISFTAIAMSSLSLNDVSQCFSLETVDDY